MTYQLLFRFLCVIILAVGGCSEPISKETTSPPNVIIVITDDQGYGDMSCHGNPNLSTPNIDALYAQSTRLTDFHVSPTCAPTRAALLTGHYANRTGVWHTIGGRSLLREGEVTIADAMTENGYATGIFGKWHLGDNEPFLPQNRGFQEVLVHGGGGVGQQPDFWNNDYFDDTYFHNGEPKEFLGYCTDVWFDNALSFIGSQKEADQPFFCYIATNAPHSPYYVEDEYVTPYQGNQEIYNPAFNGMLANLDENLGKLLNYLDENDLSKNTLLIFMTDNGTSDGIGNRDDKEVGYNAGMRGKKGSMYEGGHRVPFFLRWPGGNIPENHDVTELTAHVDVFPTLIDMLDLKLSSDITFDGISLKSLIHDGDTSQTASRVLITDSQRLEYPEKWRQSSTMQGLWRLINGEELYNLEGDPEQQTNVADQYPEKKEELRSAYESWWQDIEPSFDDTPYITVCSPQSPVATLYTHDMHMAEGYNSVAWNQKLIREGMKSEGWWAVEFPQSGTYRFTLNHWPAQLETKYNESVPARPAVPGTTVSELPAGAVLNINQASLTLGDYEERISLSDSHDSVTFSVSVDAGEYELWAAFEDESGESFSAYYVQVEKAE
ncbi:MAG: arylsulfatase [Bacteroidota bacterium]